MTDMCFLFPGSRVVGPSESEETCKPETSWVADRQRSMPRRPPQTSPTLSCRLTGCSAFVATLVPFKLRLSSHWRERRRIVSDDLSGVKSGRAKTLLAWLGRVDSSRYTGDLHSVSVS